MPAIYVPLSADKFECLRELARAKRRRPQDQAAILVERALAEIEAASDGPRPDKPGEETA